MIVSFHLLVCFVDDFLTPQWQKNVRYIAREVIKCLNEQRQKNQLRVNHIPEASSPNFFWVKLLIVDSFAGSLNEFRESFDVFKVWILK